MFNFNSKRKSNLMFDLEVINPLLNKKKIQKLNLKKKREKLIRFEYQTKLGLIF